MRRRTGIIFLIFIGLIVYFNALQNDFIIGDDEDQIVYHTPVHSLKNIPTFFAGSTYYRAENESAYGLYYRPLMLSVYSLIYTFFGPDPLYYHFTQLLLHITNATLVFLFLRHFLRSRLAFLGSLIFLIHLIFSHRYFLCVRSSRY